MRDSIVEKLLCVDSKKFTIILSHKEREYIEECTNGITHEDTPKRTFNKRASCFVQGINQDKQCKMCDSSIPFRDFKTYLKQYYCSTKCKYDDVENVNANARKALIGNKQVSEKRKQTFLHRYNQDNAMRVDSIKEKRKQNCLQNYGVEHTCLVPGVIQKRKETCIKKYGCTNYLSYLAKNNHPKIALKYKDLTNLSNLKPLFSQEEYTGIIKNTVPVIYKFECRRCGGIVNKHIGSWSDEESCPYCDGNINKYEKKIEDFLIKHNITYNTHDRTILEGKEIDFILPKLKVGIEINGLYYHSSKFLNDTKYHLNKTQRCAEKGYKLLHIFGDELNNTKALFTRLKSILNLNKIKVAGRSCYVKTISSKQRKAFLTKYHLQGDCIGGSVSLGLFYKNRLLSIMVFGKKRKSLGSSNTNNSYELYRYCCMNNITVHGGASKLFKYFLNNYNPHEVISFCDMRYSTLNDNFYTKLGLEYSHTTKPNYWVVIGNKRYHRFGFRKSLLKEKLSIFNAEHTEKANLYNNNIHTIYDCGSILYKKYHRV